ncbi:MAG: hypothetical protein MZV49_06385 [Rhodopseudomonas palustris]|nr:hypothetical protein [Rhodopseudomonas palustris]
MMAKDPALLLHHGEHAQPQGIPRAPPRAGRRDRRPDPGRPAGVGATFNQPYESLLSGRAARPARRISAGSGSSGTVPWRRRARLLQSRRPRPGRPDAPDPGQGRHPLHGHEPLSRGLLPLGQSRRDVVLTYSPGHYGNAAAYLNAPPAEGAKTIQDKLAKWTALLQRRAACRPSTPCSIPSTSPSRPTSGPLMRPLERRRGVRSTSCGTPRPGSSSRPSTSRRPSSRPSPASGPVSWLYIHGPTHHWAITAPREAARLLPAAEAFGIGPALLEGELRGATRPSCLEAAWQAAIYPDHGWGGKEGQVTDRLFRKKYEFARDEGRAMLDDALARTRRPRPGSIRPRASPSLSSTALLAGDRPRGCRRRPRVPSAIASWIPKRRDRATSSASPHGTSGPGRGPAVEFMADDVPALGYKTFYLVPDEGSLNAAAGPGRGRAPGRRERASIGSASSPAAWPGLFDKELGREVLDTGKFLGFEVFTMRSVGNGAGEFGRVQQPTMEGFDQL